MTTAGYLRAVLSTPMPLPRAGARVTVIVIVNPFDANPPERRSTSFAFELTEVDASSPASLEDASRRQQVVGRSFSALRQNRFADGWTLGYSYTDPGLGTSYWSVGRRTLDDGSVICEGNARDEHQLDSVVEGCHLLSTLGSRCLRTWLTVPLAQGAQRNELTVSVHVGGDLVAETFVRVRPGRVGPALLSEARQEAIDRECAIDLVDEELPDGWALTYEAQCGGSMRHHAVVYRVVDDRTLLCNATAASVDLRRAELDSCATVRVLSAASSAGSAD